MSDPETELTPAQDDAVRALLAAARHTDPTPPEVVARLDDALASLASDRLEARAPVVTLASRRRRTAGTLLLAAAAVVVAGVGIGQVLPNGTSGSDAGSTSEASDSAGSAESPMSEPFGATESPDEDGADTKQGDTSSRSAQESAPAPLSGATALTTDSALKPQVRRLRNVAGAADSAYTVCAVPDVGTASTVSVTVDGLPGALVFRAPSGSIQRVDVFLCSEREAFRTVTLRAP